MVCEVLDWPTKTLELMPADYLRYHIPGKLNIGKNILLYIYNLYETINERLIFVNTMLSKKFFNCICDQCVKKYITKSYI